MLSDILEAVMTSILVYFHKNNRATVWKIAYPHRIIGVIIYPGIFELPILV